MTAERESEAMTPAQEVQFWMDRFDPKIQDLLRSVGTALRERFPTANELAYDYTSHIVISYAPADKGIDGIFGVAARHTGVFLYFNQGQNLPDPGKILQGKGKATRFIELQSAGDMHRPEVEVLIRATLDQAKIHFPQAGQGRLIIKSSAATKRPRKN